jgi:hypothetical protein
MTGRTEEYRKDYEARSARAEQLRAQGDHSAAAAVMKDVAHTALSDAFAELVERKHEDIKDTPRNWAGLPIYDAPTDHGAE